MKTIKVQKLSNEKFARYGEYQNLLDDKELAKKSIFPGGFFADVMKLDLGSTTLPTVSVCQAMKPEKMEVKMLEAHQFTCEACCLWMTTLQSLSEHLLRDRSSMWISWKRFWCRREPL